MNRLRALAIVIVAVAMGLAVAPAKAGLFTIPSAPAKQTSNQLKHLIFIVMENRSFDNYFGVYPGANGLPTTAPCVPDGWTGGCDTPYPDHDASNQGGPYMAPYQVVDVDGGKMDGFVNEREKQLGPNCKPKNGLRPDPSRVVQVEMDEEGTNQNVHCIVDVMGYHTSTDIPNYYSYAENYVLFDNFFESAQSWSLPAHLALFSGWAAQCGKISPPQISTCKSSLTGKDWATPMPSQTEPKQPYLWTDITYLLYQNNVTWSAYLDGGLGSIVGAPPTKVQGIWIPLGGFETVNQDGQYANAVGSTVTDFDYQAAAGTLPQVSWVIPNYNDSDHPQASIANGQAFVTSVVNAVMAGPDWSSSAILIVWDDMGGFYDHATPPPAIDKNGPGMRIPALLISPYSKTNFVDHQILTTDSFIKLIEETFLNGETMAQSGRADPRPDYRETSTELGDIMNDFNFTQQPKRPMLLLPHPMTMLRENVPNPTEPVRLRPSGTRTR